MFYCHQIAVVRVKREQVALVKEVFVVVESAFPFHFLVASIDFSNHHVDENKPTYNSDQSQTQVPNGVRRLEDSSSGGEFNESEKAGGDAGASFLVLGEECSEVETGCVEQKRGSE